MFNHEPTPSQKPDPEFQIKFQEGLRRILLAMWAGFFLCNISFLWQSGELLDIALTVFVLLNLVWTYRWNPAKGKENGKHS